jgi:glycerophosphoryl diester phosphodiesterase
MGAEMVELDVQQTKDGQLVVIHDPWVDRVTNGSGNVREMTLAEFRRGKTKEGESLPTLEEIYALCKGRIGVLTEIKTIGIGRALADLIERMGNRDEVVVQSFLHGELLKFREFDAQTRTAPLFDELLLDAPTLAGYTASLGCNGVTMPFKSLRRELVDAMHGRGFFVYCWGGEAGEVQLLGVDGHIASM